jgi:DNA-binding NarL/FixJ family response regulator
MSSPIRILLAEDHTLVRAGIRSLLAGFPDVQVVAEAGDGREALRLIKAQHPDVVLIDISMPELNGLETLARAVKQFPTVRFIVLSMHANEEYVLRALQAGAQGYVLKDATAGELELAVRSVAQGEIYFGSALSRQVILNYLQRTGSEKTAGEARRIGLDRLTPRQREILQLIAEGNTTQRIANKLGISVKTVETHRAQVMERLGIHDIPGLVRYAIRQGLVESDRK